MRSSTRSDVFWAACLLATAFSAAACGSHAATKNRPAARPRITASPAVLVPSTPHTTPALVATLASGAAVTAVAFSPDGTTVAGGGRSDATRPSLPRAQVRIWDVATKRVLVSITDDVASLAFSSDGKLAAVTGDTVTVWNAANGHSVAAFTGAPTGLEGVAFSTDGATLAAAGADYSVHLWDVRSGDVGAVLTGNPGRYDPPIIHTVAFDATGTTVASDYDASEIALWDVASTQTRFVLPGRIEDLHGVAFSADGKTVVAAGDLGAIRVRDVATGQLRKTISGNPGQVWSMALSPDGTIVLTGAENGSVFVWDVATGRELATLTGQTKTINSVAFSPDGRTFAAGSQDGTIRVWRFPG